MLTAGGVAVGQIQFEPHTISSSADGAHSVFAIDLDQDNDIDVLSTSVYLGIVDWYENDGSENFTTHEITTDAEGANSVFAIDVDGDEDIDVLSASVDDDKIAWYENDGSENFTECIVSSQANGAISVYAIDVDNDGDVDVLSASFFDDKISWYENLGYAGIQNLTISIENNDVVLNWTAIPGVQYYNIYRYTTPYFDISTMTATDITYQTYYYDEAVVTGGPWFYVLTADY